jgi:two-component system chemotaxis response regulator CheY
MNADRCRARLADTVLAAEHPLVVLQGAARILSDELQRAVTVCDPATLEVWAASSGIPLLVRDESAGMFADGRPSSVIDAGPFSIVVTPPLHREVEVAEFASVVAGEYTRMRDAVEPALKRVVVADDTPGMRLLIREFLGTEAGFVVVGEATTGFEALTLTEALQPDLVVLDLSMPEMDGMSAIPELRRLAPHTGILVISGFGGPMVQRALDAGAHAYIEKGVDFEQLVPRAREVAAAIAS